MPDRGSVGKTPGVTASASTDLAHYSVVHIYQGAIGLTPGAQNNAGQPSAAGAVRIPIPVGDPMFTSE